MVTANVTDLADEFDQIVSDRDVASVGVLGLAGAGGGFIAQEIVNRLAPRIGLSPSPGTPRESVGVGFLKMVLGVALGFGGLKVGGTVGTLAALAGLGTLILGGGNWINAVMNVGGTMGSAPRASARTATTTVSANQPTATPVQDEEVRFRASADGSGGSQATARTNGSGSETFR